MNKKVLIVDTCLACVWMQVPGMDVAGSDNNRWDYARLNEKIKSEVAAGALLVLPLASIIETGNHITQIKNTDRLPFVTDFAEKIRRSIDGDSPWAAYCKQKTLWEDEHLKEVVERWEAMNKAHGKHSLGDVSILDVATAYRSIGFEVEILTADELLKAYESVDLPEIGMLVPRRRAYSANKLKSKYKH